MLPFLMVVTRHAKSTQNTKYAVSLQYFKKELSFEVDVLHADKHENLLQVDSTIFDGFGQACPNYAAKFAISLWHPKKEVSNLTALAGSNTILTIYYTSHVLPSLTLFLSQYWIHTKPFHLSNCLSNISSLLFQFTLVPCKLARLNDDHKAIRNYIIVSCPLPIVFVIPHTKFHYFDSFRHLGKFLFFTEKLVETIYCNKLNCLLETVRIKLHRLNRLSREAGYKLLCLTYTQQANQKNTKKYDTITFTF